MKNIQIIEGADNCTFDIFSATAEQFALIFPASTDVAFIEEVYERECRVALDVAFNDIWTRRVSKKEAFGIHGTLFYGLNSKKQYYPDYTDEGACNPDGTKLRG